MRQLPDLDPQALSQLSAELAGEEILWAGRPSERVTFRRAMPVWLIGVPWTAFAAGWEAMALSAYFAEKERESGGVADLFATIFPLFGVPFVLIGLFMLIAPFRAAWRARRMVHILTDRRLVSAVLGRESLKVTSVDPARILSTKRVQGADGAGNLTLAFSSAPVPMPTTVGHGGPVMMLEEASETLWGVPQVAVLDALLRARMMPRAPA